MKVLFVNAVNRISGAEIVMLAVVRAARKETWEVSAVCPPGGPLPEELERAGVSVYTAPLIPLSLRHGLPGLFRFVLSFFLALPTLWRVVKQHRPDVIYANSLSALVFVLPVVRFIRIPVIWHVHDVFRGTRFNRLIVGFIGASATRIIAISRAVLQSLESLGVPRGRVAVIYNGTTLPALSPTIRAERNTVTIGIVGQITPWKGHDVFLTAASQVAQRYPQARFLVVGEPLFGENDYLAWLKRRAQELGLSNRVQFNGYVQAIGEIMSSLDVLVNASRLEPFGLTLIEAMAHGVPVVASRAGGPLEIVVHGETGFLFPPGNATELAVALGRLMEEPSLRRDMGRRARCRVATHFCEKHQVGKILRLLDELVAH